MKQVVAHSLMLAALGALPVRAAELELGLETGAVYDDNVFSSPTDPQSDVAGRVGPRLRALDQEGSLTWEAAYRPTYEAYLDLDEASDWDHDLAATLDWALGPRTTLRLAERFLDASDINGAFIAAPGADPTLQPNLVVGTSRSRLNRLSGSLEHALGQRHAASLSVSRYDESYESDLESAVTALQGSYLYQLGRLDRLGLLLSATQQEVERESFERDPTRFYNASFQWIRTFDPTLTLAASAGPAWVDQPPPETVDVIPERPRYPLIPTALGPAPIRASTCPRNGRGQLFLGTTCQGFGPGEVVFLPAEFVDLRQIGSTPSTGSDLTYFASLELTKQWRDVGFTLSYVRDASTTSQVSGLVSDTVSTSVIWAPPARRWGVSLYASFQRRELPTGSGIVIQEIVQPSTVGGVSDVAEAIGFGYDEVSTTANVDDYLAGLYVTYDLLVGRAASGQQAQLYLNVGWQRQELDSDLLGSTRWDRLRVGAGVIYTLPRIQLPF